MKVKREEKEKLPPKPVTEDDLYRHLTQFRMWSFTAAQLKEKRSKVNSQGKRRALRKMKLLCESEDNSYSFEEAKNLLEFVTEEEELKEISYYVDALHKLATSVLKLPSQVRATAIAFLKRFYLVHSVMEYHPKKVLATLLFLAAKSENCFMAPKTLADFIGSKTTPELILELEFQLTLSLNFTLLCHHPYRALHGFLFDFQSVLIHQNPEGVILKDGGSPEKIAAEQIMKVYVRAREYADDSLISDAAFLYTPPQIALACFYKADENLTKAYLTYKFVKAKVEEDVEMKVEEDEIKVKTEIKDEFDDDDFGAKEAEERRRKEEEKKKLEEEKRAREQEERQARLESFQKIWKTVKECVEVVNRVSIPTMEEAKSINRKVQICINPDKLLKKKRQGSPEGGDQKRAKLE